MTKAGQPGGASPSDKGWTAIIPDDEWCSVQDCAEPAICAVRRLDSRGRRLQPYCQTHSRARGVEAAGQELAWTPTFLQRRQTSARTSW